MASEIIINMASSLAHFTTFQSLAVAVSAFAFDAPRAGRPRAIHSSQNRNEHINCHIIANPRSSRRCTNILTLSAAQKGSGDNDDMIFFDDFADVVGDSFSSSSSQLQLPSRPLPDFDEGDSSSSAAATSSQTAITSTAIATNTKQAVISGNSYDLTGATVRQFSLGPDILLSDYVGSLGFDQVTDWQYYLESVDEEGNVDPYQERIEVQAPFMDPSRPARTRSKSGSVVRIFRGEFRGKLGGMLRSNGMDNRVLIKEYSPDSLDLASNEKEGIGRIMSHWLENVLLANTGSKSSGSSAGSGTLQPTDLLEELQTGDWIEAASSRYTDSITDTPTKADDQHLYTLLSTLTKYKAPFTSLLGEMNLNDYYDDPNLDPNEWYRSLGVKPPTPGSVWLIYDYHGLSTADSYCQPLIFQQSKRPPKRGVFGNIVQPPPLPPFKERARYVVQGVLKQMLTAVAETHEAGLVHKSLGRNSFILSSVGMDKREATSPYAVVVDRLRVVLSDWGFSQTIQDALEDEEFQRRAKSFGLDAEYDVEAAEEFALAEDLHALGFVFLALLFTTLSEPATLSAPMPKTNDDTWQRLFTDLFQKDMNEFREYCSNEDVWESVVELLDREEGAGWNVLGELLLARENVSKWSKGEIMDEDYELVSARTLLSSPFFQMRTI
ncbi:hypothetical protein ACHAXN_004617 [Cyclotella atomus]